MVLDRTAAIEQRQQWTGNQIVFTNGCFDVLHAGHIEILEQAKSFGDKLIVGLNSDDSVRALKGPSRPVQNEGDRARILAAIRYVDMVVIFSEETPIELIQAIRPNIHVKGGDYQPTDLAEYEPLKDLGAEIKIIPLLEGRSSSRIIDG